VLVIVVGLVAAAHHTIHLRLVVLALLGKDMLALPEHQMLEVVVAVLDRLANKQHLLLHLQVEMVFRHQLLALL
jgi:hypothetical protein